MSVTRFRSGSMLWVTLGMWGTALGVIAVLVILKVEYTREFERLPKLISTNFDYNLLGSPEDKVVDFDSLERFESEIKDANPWIEQVIITKIPSDGPERIVHPPLKMGGQPAPKNLPHEPVIHERKVFGYIYLKLNQQKMSYINLGIWSVIILVLLATIFLMFWSARQSARYTATVVELEAKTRELIRLEQLALVGLLTANIFHDLKKPILNIRDEIESLPSGPERNAVNEQIGLFFTMLRDLNLEGFVRAESEKGEYIDLHEIIQKSVNLVKYEQEQVRVEIDLADDLPLILGIPHRVIQVFSNLILNAYTAMEGKGLLQIQGSNITRQAPWAIIKIHDNGTGISEKNLKHIFDPFFTTKTSPESTGLGLYITKNIVESMGGEITAESRSGIGTTFTISLPGEIEGN